ncbi:MAG: sigma-70 family RNA polymerase sigma factor [Anaerolineae bacterium]
MTLIDQLLPDRRPAPSIREADIEAEMVRAAAHDPAALAPLYERYAARLYAYCLRRVDHPHDAEDLTSAIFARALDTAHGYRGGLVAAWLFRIARSMVANYFRSRKPSVSLEGLPAEGAWALDSGDQAEPLDQVMRAEEQRALHRLIAELRDDERDLLALRIAAGLSAEEVGAIFGTSAGAIRTRTHRLIQHLRAELRRRHPDDEELA